MQVLNKIGELIGTPYERGLWAVLLSMVHNWGLVFSC